MHTKKLYPIVKETVRDGWLSEEKMEWFEKIITDYPKENINAVEIGVFYGFSACATACLFKELDKYAMLHAIDPWTAAACVEGENAEGNNTWWSSLDLELAYNSFLKFIKVLDVEKYVHVIRMKGEDALNEVTQPIDLLHIDGNHSTEKCVMDCELWFPKMVVGGYIVADDIGWGTVQPARDWLRERCEVIYEQLEGQTFGVYKVK